MPLSPGRYKRCICLVGELFASQYYSWHAKPPLLPPPPPTRCSFQSILRNIWFPLRPPPVLPFNIQYWEWQYGVKADFRPGVG